MMMIWAYCMRPRMFTYAVLVDMVDAQHPPLPNDHAQVLVGYVRPGLDDSHLYQDVISLVVAHRNAQISIFLPAIIKIQHGPIGIVRWSDLLSVDRLELITRLDAGQRNGTTDLADKELGLGATKGRGAAQAAPTTGAGGAASGWRIAQSESPIGTAPAAGVRSFSVVVFVYVAKNAAVRPTLGPVKGDGPQEGIPGIVHKRPHLGRQDGGDGAGLRGWSSRSSRDAGYVDLLDSA